MIDEINKNYFVFTIILLALAVLLFPSSDAAAGNYCTSDSPCSCGPQCQNGGYESNNSFNTIDGHLISGCQDGAEDAYEYTHDINITDLDRDIFAEGDKIRIDGKAKCDGSGDYVMFLYYNGTRWKHLGFSVCSNPGINTFSKNVTLDQGVGNHTVRVSTFWAENTNDACASTQQCGKDCEAVYSDTDDLTFYVQEAETKNPQVELLFPSAGREFIFEQGYRINISASVNDTNDLSSVEANVTWTSGSKTVNLVQVGNIYIGNFTDETYLGRYNVTIIAEDIFGNINNTETTFFHINKSVNITLFSPTGFYTNGTNLNLKFEVRDEYNIDTVQYEFNSDGIKKADFSVGLVNNQSPNFIINNSVYNNLSQSFNFSQELEVRRIEFYLRKTGNINDIIFDIRTDSSGPTDTILANGSIDSNLITGSFGFITGYLNATTTLQADTTYWVVITTNGNSTDYIEWQTNDDLISRGNSYYNGTHNTSYDFLIKVKDEFLFNTTIDSVLGKNNITIYKNNTLGVEQSKVFSFTFDNTNPTYTEFDYYPSLELGNIQTFSINTSDAYSDVDTALVEFDSQNYTMILVDYNVFNYSYVPNTTGIISFSFYINDSAGNLNHSQTLTFEVNDTSFPNFINVSHAPTSVDDIDPNTTIVVSANVTDYSNLSKVVLEYKRQPGSWHSKLMNNYGLYVGNFTPNTTGTWIYRVFANDTFSNLDYSQNYSIYAGFDSTWTTSPKTFGFNSTIIGSKITIGKLIVNNTGDFDRTFNISNSGTPTVVYNRTMPFTLQPGEVEEIEINVTAPITEANYVIIFTIHDTTNNTKKYSNVTLVAYDSGPFLFLEMPVFDNSVAQGEHINLISLKITNLGNETSTNTVASWSLPSGITSRDNLNRNISDLAVGAVSYYNISADVSGSATTGTHSVSAYANNSEGTYKIITRSITITGNSSPPAQDPPGGSSGSSSPSVGPAGGIVVSPPDISTDLKEIKVPRGRIYETEFKLINNESVKTYYNITLEIEGLFKIFYNLSPNNIKRLRTDESRNIKLVFNLPDYFSEGVHNLKLIIDPINTDSIEKDFRIIVYDDRENLMDCLNKSNSFIREMREGGINVESWQRKQIVALENFNESNYNLVRAFCSNLDSYYETYKNQKQSLDSLTSRVVQLKEEGYTTEEMEEFLKLINNTFYQGNFDKMDELMTEARLLIDATTTLQKPATIRISEFFVSNKTLLLVLLITLPILVFVTQKILYITNTENRIKNLEKEKQKILSLMKKAQINYFKDSLINKSLYDTYVKNYRERIGDINVNLANLKLEKNHYIKPASEEHILRNQKEELGRLIKENQDNYYNKRIIDYESYSKLEEFYTAILSDVEQKLPPELERDVEEEVIEELEGETTKLDNKIRLPVSDKVSFSITEDVYNVEYDEKPQKVLVYFDEDRQVYTKQIEDRKKPEESKKEPKKKRKNKSDKKRKIQTKIDKKKFIKLTNPKEYFYLVDGIILKSISDLYSAVSIMDDSVFNHHVSNERNDFALWIEGVFGEKKLADKILRAETKSQMKEILKKYLGDPYE